MGLPIATRLRFIESKDKEKIISYVNSLPYRIEIKGGPVYAKNKWALFFVLPDDDKLKEALSGSLD